MSNWESSSWSPPHVGNDEHKGGWSSSSIPLDGVNSSAASQTSYDLKVNGDLEAKAINLALIPQIGKCLPSNLDEHLCPEACKTMDSWDTESDGKQWRCSDDSWTSKDNPIIDNYHLPRQPGSPLQLDGHRYKCHLGSHGRRPGDESSCTKDDRLCPSDMSSSKYWSDKNDICYSTKNDENDRVGNSFENSIGKHLAFRNPTGHCRKRKISQPCHSFNQIRCSDDFDEILLASSSSSCDGWDINAFPEQKPACLGTNLDSTTSSVSGWDLCSPHEPNQGSSVWAAELPSDSSVGLCQKLEPAGSQQNTQCPPHDASEGGWNSILFDDFPSPSFHLSWDDNTENLPTTILNTTKERALEKISQKKPKRDLGVNIMDANWDTDINPDKNLANITPPLGDGAAFNRKDTQIRQVLSEGRSVSESSNSYCNNVSYDRKPTTHLKDYFAKNDDPRHHSPVRGFPADSKFTRTRRHSKYKSSGGSLVSPIGWNDHNDEHTNGHVQLSNSSSAKPAHPAWDTAVDDTSWNLSNPVLQSSDSTPITPEKRENKSNWDSTQSFSGHSAGPNNNDWNFSDDQKELLAPWGSSNESIDPPCTPTKDTRDNELSWDTTNYEVQQGINVEKAWGDTRGISVPDIPSKPSAPQKNVANDSNRDFQLKLYLDEFKILLVKISETGSKGAIKEAAKLLTCDRGNSELEEQLFRDALVAIESQGLLPHTVAQFTSRLFLLYLINEILVTQSELFGSSLLFRLTERACIISKATKRIFHVTFDQALDCAEKKLLLIKLLLLWKNGQYFDPFWIESLFELDEDHLREELIQKYQKTVEFTPLKKAPSLDDSIFD